MDAIWRIAPINYFITWTVIARLQLIKTPIIKMSQKYHLRKNSEIFKNAGFLAVVAQKKPTSLF